MGPIVLDSEMWHWGRAKCWHGCGFGRFFYCALPVATCEVGGGGGLSWMLPCPHVGGDNGTSLMSPQNTCTCIIHLSDADLCARS